MITTRVVKVYILRFVKFKSSWWITRCPHCHISVSFRVEFMMKIREKMGIPVNKSPLLIKKTTSQSQSIRNLMNSDKQMMIMILRSVTFCFELCNFKCKEHRIAKHMGGSFNELHRPISKSHSLIPAVFFHQLISFWNHFIYSPDRNDSF